MLDRPTQRCLTQPTSAGRQVKHRLGVDDHESFEELARFVATAAAAGVRHFSVHARKAVRTHTARTRLVFASIGHQDVLDPPPPMLSRRSHTPMCGPRPDLRGGAQVLGLRPSSNLEVP